MSTKPKASKQTARQVAAATPAKQRARKVAPPPALEPTGTKKTRLIALLQTSCGCTIAQMTELTGWQPHYADVLVMPTIIGNPACVAESATMKSA